jgi:hypothetical protein
MGEALEHSSEVPSGKMIRWQRDFDDDDRLWNRARSRMSAYDRFVTLAGCGVAGFEGCVWASIQVSERESPGAWQ